MPIKSIKIDTKMQAYGDCDDEGNIRINPKKGDVVNTIIHEKLHADDFEMPHGEVYKQADKTESQMSLPEMAQTLMNAHEMAQQTAKNKREWTYTKATKIIKSQIK